MQKVPIPFANVRCENDSAMQLTQSLLTIPHFAWVIRMHPVCERSTRKWDSLALKQSFSLYLS